MTEDASPSTDEAPRGPGAPAPTDAPDDGDLAPRPRPGFRSRPAVDATEKAALFAGVLRACLGAAGLFAAVLYLPIHIATPILAGVSILMMVTGTTSTWRAVRSAPPAYRKIPAVLGAACLLATGVSVVLTLVFGAGAFGPVAAAREAARAQAEQEAREAPPTVRFEPAP
jgi:hypothetical protein